MSNINYTNPNSINPSYNTDFTTGGLGGVWAQQDRSRYRQQASVQDLMSLLSLMKQAQEREEYNLGAPLRGAQRDAGIATARATQQTAIPRAHAEVAGLEAGNISQQLKNFGMAATQPSEITAIIAQNAAKQGAAGVQKLQQAVTVLGSLAAITQQPGPDTPARIQQIMKQYNMSMDDPMVQAIIGSGNPQEIHVRARKFFEVMSQADEQTRRVLAQEEMQQKGQTDREHIRGRYGLQRSRETASAKNKTYKQLLQSATSVEQAYSRAMAILSDPEADAESRAMAQEVYTKAAQALSQMRNRGGVGIENGRLVPNAPPQIPGMGQPQGSPQSPQDPLGIRR